eukprot:gene45311-21953_t
MAADEGLREAAIARLRDATRAGDADGMEQALPDAELAVSLLPDPQCDDDARTRAAQER